MKADKYLKNLVCLYVEDDKSVREPLSMLLDRYFKNVLVAENGAVALDLFKSNNVDIIISDIKMPVMNGIEFIEEVRKIDDDVIVIFITAFNDFNYLTRAIELSVDAYLNKPLDKDILVSRLNKFANTLKLKLENEFYHKIMQEVFDKTNIPMLILKDGNILLKNRAFDYLFPNPDVNKLKSAKNRFVIEKYDYNIILEVENEELNDNLVLKTFKDITKYEMDIFTDELTKLNNRKVVDSYFIHRLGGSIGIVMLDIDNFKIVNDTYGHDMGDNVLVSLSNILKRFIRKDDLAIRWGGEEFVLVFNEINDVSILKHKAEAIRQEVENHYVDGVGHFSISLGVCVGSVNSKEDFISLVNKSDKALYVSKNSGKNRVSVCKELES